MGCYTCENYLPTSDQKVGLCTRLSAVGVVNHVDSSMQTCRYDLVYAPQQLTAAEIRERDRMANAERKRFYRDDKLVREINGFFKENR